MNPAKTDITVALGLFASDADYDYGHLLAELSQLGVRAVQLDVRLVQDDVRANTVGFVLPTSPDWVTIDRTLTQAQRLGLEVDVMPIVWLTSRASGEWRGTLQPNDVATWFAHYENAVVPLAALASRHGVRAFYVGSELCSLEVHADRFFHLVTAVRSHFAGVVSYSANWDHFANLPFADALDVVAVTGYFEVHGDDTVANRWPQALEAPLAFAKAHHKPLWVSEVGWPSHQKALAVPWNEHGSPDVDLDVQAEAYADLCAVLSTPPAGLDNVTIWNWFGFGGPRDTGYTPRGKPATRALVRCLASPD